MFMLVDSQEASTMMAMNIQPPRRPMSTPGAPLPAEGGDGDEPDRTTAAGDGPLSPEQIQAVTLANQRAKKLRSAARVAMFNGVSLGTFSGLSLLFVAGEAIFGEFDWLGVIMCVGLGALAWNELRGRKLLLLFNPRSTAILGWNQVALLGLIVAYAAWMLGVAMFGANPYEEAMRSEPMMAQMLGDVGGLYKTMSVTMYGSLIVGTIIFQGLNSRYYFTRARLLQAYLVETPPWVVELQRHQAASS